MGAISFRTADASDGPFVVRTLLLAVTWDPAETLEPDVEMVARHPELARYHEDWGRSGDFGIIAESDAAFCGMAFGRLFSNDDHGHGYVDAATPEIAIGVEAGVRNRGIGAELLSRLTKHVHHHGVGQLSLSVNRRNPAQRLYERMGWNVASQGDVGTIMVLTL